MHGLFKDKFRIPSARLPKWDYTRAAGYFVTLCTKGSVHSFGDVVEGEMILSPMGRIVAEEWQKTPRLRLSVELDQWQIMPNHLHGILILKEVETARRAVSRRGGSPTLGTPGETPQRGVSTPDHSRLKAGSLGAIIGQFKSACTKRIWSAGFSEFAWQARFYDHIIRNQESLDKIRDYILHNPVMWETDKDEPENLYM